MKLETVASAGNKAIDLIESNLKFSVNSNADIRPVFGISAKVDSSVVCGECSDEGGGSSGSVPVQSRSFTEIIGIMPLVLFDQWHFYSYCF